jgi:hypothetical protein
MFFNFHESKMAELLFWLVISWALLVILGHNFASITILTILCFQITKKDRF